jgi:hypothetical protein
VLSYLPVALAVLGTALMAVVIFAPVPIPATVTMSLAPPELRWESYRTPSRDPLDAPPEFSWPDAPWTQPDPDAIEATWPAQVDPRAAGCDAAARIALVDALATVGGAWANEVLRDALAGDPDAAVREAVVRAMRRRDQPDGLA